MASNSAHKIAVIAGDGIGPEVTDRAQEVLAATKVDFDYESFFLGADRYKHDGEVLGDSTLDELAKHEAILFGAVGAAPNDPAVPSGLIERGMLLKLRFAFDHYVNLRPFTCAPESSTSGQAIDIVFVREGTEGSYAGEGGFLRKGTPQEVATQGSVNTRFGVTRVVRYAFELAQSRPRKQLHLVHKTNVLTFAGDLWRRTFEEVAMEFPDVETSYDHVDAACIHLVEQPQRYDVIVTDNLFGDILTDLAGAVSGGIGSAASANLNPARAFPSMFEPVHGSAPDIAGTGKASPLAAIRSAAMMCDFLGEVEAATQIQGAVRAVLQDENLQEMKTGDVAKAVIARL